MEWKNVRRWLILLLLAADLILAGNLALQALRADQILRRAVMDAVALAEARGLSLEADVVLALPRQLPAYAARRQDALEQQMASTLLGGGVEQSAPGGGVAIYQSETGTVSFRRGGALEADTPWTWQEFDALSCAEALESAGLRAKSALREETAEGVLLTQNYNGYPLFNCQLQCAQAESRLTLSGRWLLTPELQEERQSLSRAQMVLELCALAEELLFFEVTEIRAGYVLQGDAPQNLTLIPVWSVETETGTVIISCISGEQLLF